MAKAQGVKKQVSLANKEDNYKFRRPIYRLHYLREAEKLFDDPPEVFKKKTTRCLGKIMGIEVMIVLPIDSSSRLCAKTQEDLNKVYDEITGV